MDVLQVAIPSASSSGFNYIRTFDAVFAFFSIMMTCTIIMRKLADHWTLLVCTLLYFAAFYSVECILSNILHKIATSSSYFNSTPHWVLIWFFALTLLIIGGIYFIVNPLSAGTDFVSTYLSSLFTSIVIFLISTAIKCLIVGTGFFNSKYMRRGFFGVFQRIFILIRGILIIPYWCGFFLNFSPPPLSVCITIWPKPISYLVYLALKGIAQLWLLWDLGFTIHDYDANSAAVLHHICEEDVKEPCVICQDLPFEPVKLPCGHIFCYQCVFRWLVDHNTCPICRMEVVESRRIEFGDGLIPLAAVFAAF